MDLQSISRPNMPGSTPTPASLKASVYAGKVPPHLEKPKASSPTRTGGEPLADSAFATDNLMRKSTKDLIRSTSAKQRQRVLQQKTLTKIVSKLPYELRETVTAVLTMAFSTSENIQKDLDASHQENFILHNELLKKVTEIQTLQKSVENYKSQLKIQEESVESLKDNIDARQKFSLKHRSAMSRLATTNRMLIDALDALQGGDGNALGRLNTTTNSNGTKALLSGQISSLDDLPPSGRNGQLEPLPQRTARNQTQQQQLQSQEGEEKVTAVTNTQNEKLRESLLKIAREHYRSMKNVEHLEIKVSELKLSLRAQEQVNRNLKTELDELKTIHMSDAQEFEDSRASIDAANINLRERSFGVIDDRFKNMLEKNLFDPVDGIQQLRRILAHMATAPTTLSLNEMIAHVVSKDTMHIFDSEMISLFLLKPGAENLMHRFSARSALPTIFDMSTTRSLAADTIRIGKVFRMNNLSKCASYTRDIDGGTGIIPKRILSLPLINTRHNVIIGAVQFINKGVNDAFAEIDEMFGLIFAYQTSLLLTACVMYDALFYHSQLLRGLLEASTDLYAIIPESVSLAQSKNLTPGEVLLVLERTARDLLKCPNVRAFLVSDSLAGEPMGQLLFLPSLPKHDQQRQQQRRGMATNLAVRSAPQRSGLAGKVFTQRCAVLSGEGSLAAEWNPTVDLDPLNCAMLTAPVMDLHGNVLCVLQLIVGHRSPRLKDTDDPNDFRLFFGQAVEWLCHQLASPVRYLIEYIGKRAHRPQSTPSHIRQASAEGSHRPSFFASSDEAVSQLRIDEGSDAMSPRHDSYEEWDKSTTSERPVVQRDSSKVREEDFQSLSLQDIAKHEETFPCDNLTRDGDNTESASRKVQFQDPETLQQQAAEESRKQHIAHLEATHRELNVELQALSQTVENHKCELRTLMEENEQLKLRAKDANDAMQQSELEKMETERELRDARQMLDQLQAQQEQQLKELRESAIASENDAPKGDPQQLLDQSAELQELQNRIEQQSQLLQDSEANYLAACEACEGWKVSCTNSQAQEELLQQQLQDLQSQLTVAQQSDADQKQQVSELTEQLHDAQEHQRKQDQEMQRLLEIVQGLQKQLADKDRMQSVLQDQVIKLANQNIEKIDSVISSKPSAAVVAPNDATLPNDSAKGTANPLASTAVESSKNDETSVEQPLSPSIRCDPEETTASPAVEMSTMNASASASKKIAESDSAGAAENGDWTQMEDDFGRSYFYNTRTGESSWTDPRLRGTESRGDWDRYTDENGSEYWVNKLTGESSWSAPESVDGAGNSNGNGNDEDVDEEDLATKQRREREANGGMMLASNASQFSISAGEYTIEL